MSAFEASGDSNDLTCYECIEEASDYTSGSCRSVTPGTSTCSSPDTIACITQIESQYDENKADSQLRYRVARNCIERGNDNPARSIGVDVVLDAIETMECDTSFCNTYREEPKICYVCQDFQVDIDPDEILNTQCNNEVGENADYEMSFNSNQVCQVTRTMMKPTAGQLSPGVVTTRRLRQVCTSPQRLFMFF